MVALELYPERDCATCLDPDNRNGPALREEYGCNAKLVTNSEGKEEWVDRAALPVMIKGKEWWACPRRPLLDDPSFFWEVKAAHNHYKNGFLVDPGSINEQSHKLMSLIAIMSGAEEECREEKDRMESRTRGDPRNAGMPAKGDPRKRL